MVRTMQQKANSYEHLDGYSCSKKYSAENMSEHEHLLMMVNITSHGNSIVPASHSLGFSRKDCYQACDFGQCLGEMDYPA